MINRKFRFHRPLRNHPVVILLIPVFIFCYGCGEEENTTGPADDTPSGVLIERPYSCKTLPAEPQGSIPLDRECFTYNYDGTNLLKLNHINTAFNCCQEDIVADITIEKDTIIISETETGGLCDCICLFDLDYEITGLNTSEYTFVFSSPYLSGEDIPLTSTINLADSISGTICVKRNHYPWHNVDPSGNLVNHTGCKDYNPIKALTPGEDHSSSEDCIIYNYKTDSVLILNHINAGFNCCPTALTADFQFGNYTITITENEVLDSGCHCLCLYDLTFEMTCIPPGTYTIIINELYTKNGDSPLQFKANLIEQPHGIFCVKREIYPWGL